MMVRIQPRIRDSFHEGRVRAAPLTAAPWLVSPRPAAALAPPVTHMSRRAKRLGRALHRVDGNLADITRQGVDHLHAGLHAEFREHRAEVGADGVRGDA